MLLALRKLNLPVQCFYDCDPGGINCFLALKFGSFNAAGTPDATSNPHIQWCGIRPSELSRQDPLRLKPLTQLDRKQLNDTLKRNYLQGFPKFLSEIKTLLDLNQKMSIFNNDFTNYVKLKMNKTQEELF